MANMKTWNFKVKSNPHEIIKKLDSAFVSVDGMVFNTHHDENDSIVFKVRKRVKDGFAIHDNLIIVKGKMSKTDIENETDIKISFSQHFLRIMVVSIYLVLGLLAVILGISDNAIIFIFAGFLLVIGIAIWIDVQKKYQKDIQKYKSLISEILEL